MYGHGCGGAAQRHARREAHAEMREAHLQTKAVHAAMHGNVARASVLQMKANMAHQTAEREHHMANTFGHHHHHHHRHSPVPSCSPCVPSPFLPGLGSTVVVHHVNPTPPVNYPLGTVAPPPAQPPPAYQPAGNPYTAAPTYPAAPAYPAAPSYPAAPIGYPAQPAYPAAPAAPAYPGPAAYPNPYQ
ncbi:vegetative cell wall protein gp1-like isoform X3 [Patiria miniata]|uniref:Uncharacterized protein n=1 Tax=Patiria miniata TaxID=46514 RepID=A0A914AYI4_PATMI|nr:vegetative cell wall protein gp1-like isoform X3 [Patiria miniata]